MRIFIILLIELILIPGLCSAEINSERMAGLFTIGQEDTVSIIIDLNELSLPSSFMVQEYIPAGWDWRGSIPDPIFFDGSKGLATWLFLGVTSPIKDTVIYYNVTPTNNDDDFLGKIILESNSMPNSGFDEILTEGSYADKTKILAALNLLKNVSGSNWSIVIGEEAEAEDNVAAIDIAGAFNISNIIHDTTYAGYGNVLVVGGPCANKFALDLHGNPQDCAEEFSPGKGVIKLYRRDRNFQILVAGYDALQTRIAARVLVNYISFHQKMNASKVTTYGTGLEDFYAE